MLALLILAVGLAMDSFAVSLVRGSTSRKKLIPAIELGLAFGLAQGLMPLLGWGLGAAFGRSFENIDHWIAFVLLGVLGSRMIAESFSESEAPSGTHHGRLFGLTVAAFATSVDAAVAGLTLPLLGVAIPIACLIIGSTTAILCTAGFLAASYLGERTGQLAERIGGLVLIGLGVKILISHLS